MEPTTLVMSITAGAGFVTVLIAWFKLSRGSRAADIRIQGVERTVQEMKNFCNDLITCEAAERLVTELKERLQAFEVSMRKEVDDFTDKLDSFNVSMSGHDREIVRMQEVAKFIESYKNRIGEIESLRAEFLEKFTRRGDFIREMQVLNSQVTAIYQKIDRVEEKIDDRLRPHR